MIKVIAYFPSDPTDPGNGHTDAVSGRICYCGVPFQSLVYFSVIWVHEGHCRRH